MNHSALNLPEIRKQLELCSVGDPAALDWFMECDLEITCFLVGKLLAAEEKLQAWCKTPSAYDCPACAVLDRLYKDEEVP